MHRGNADTTTKQNRIPRRERIHTNSRLKTPDALHVATAVHAECSLFITNDDDFRRVEALPILILDDFT